MNSIILNNVLLKPAVYMKKFKLPDSFYLLIHYLHCLMPDTITTKKFNTALSYRSGWWAPGNETLPINIFIKHFLDHFKECNKRKYHIPGQFKIVSYRSIKVAIIKVSLFGNNINRDMKKWPSENWRWCNRYILN